jgi:hypothetical protein
MKCNRRSFLLQTAAAGVLPFPQSSTSNTPDRSRLLSAGWPASRLAGALLPRDSWKPFPPAQDRASWQGLPADAREAAIRAGEPGLHAGWPVLPASVFLDYKRNGNRSRYEDLWFERRERLRQLVLAECFEGKGRFLDEIANGIWAVCEETSWVLPAHLGLQKRGPGLPDVTEPVIDLFAAETGAQLAWTAFLLPGELDTVHPQVRERIALEIERRILTPFRAREDFWWMHGVNNWNPWIHSNCLACALLLERDRMSRAQTVYKVLRELDYFLASYPDDGSCDEGPSYWCRAGASVFDNLELLHSASGGAIDFYSLPLVKEMGKFIYRAHIHDRWFVNCGDAPARLTPPGDLIFRYGRRTGDLALQGLGAYFQGGSDDEESLGRNLPALFNLAALRRETPRQPQLRDVWLPGMQLMTSRRKQGSAEGLFLAAQAGHNGKSHNHNDVGNFVVYVDGQPAIIDVGPETYTAKTFSDQRYEIWTNQSAYHNLPTVNGVMQAPGRQFAAREVRYEAGDAAAELQADIAGAYPPEAGIVSWKRSSRLDRAANAAEIRDSWELKQSGGRFELSLMTVCQVAQPRKGELVLSVGGPNSQTIRLLFDGTILTASVEEIRIEDKELREVWGEGIRRVLLKAGSVPAQGESVIRIAAESV